MQTGGSGLASSPLPFCTSGESHNHLQSNKKKHKQSILVFFFVFRSASLPSPFLNLLLSL